MRTFFLVAILFFLLIRNSFGQFPYLEKHWWEPDGIVNAIEIDTARNKVYLGGDFKSVFYPIQNIAFLNPNVSIPDTRYPSFGFTQIYASVPDGNGGFYLGGSFTQIGNIVRNNITHIDASGSVTSKFSGLGFNGDVKQLQLENDTLIAMGSFNSFGPVRNNAVMLNSVSGSVVSAFPEINNRILCLAEDGDGGFYIGGLFSKVGDSLRNGLAHIDSSLNVTAWNPDITGIPNCIAVKGDTVIVGGIISKAGGQPRSNLAAFDGNSGNVLSWNPVVNSSVSEMAVYQQQLYLIGNFTAVNGMGPPYFSAVDLNTGNTAPVPNTSSSPYNSGNCALKIIGDTAYIGGDFSQFQNMPRNNIAAFNLINNSVTSWFAQGVDSTVNAIAYSNGRMIIAGLSFNIPIIDFNLGQTFWMSHSNDKYDIAVSGDTAFIGTYNFDHKQPIIGIDLLTKNFINVNFPCTGHALFIYFVNGKLLVSGHIRGVLSSVKNQICQLDVVTGTALQWTAPSMNESASDLIVDGNEMFVSGKFSMIGDSLRPLVASLDRFTGQINSWKCNAFTWGWEAAKIYKKNNIIFLGGRFEYLVNAVTRTNLIAIDGQTGGVFNWSPYCSSEIFDITANDSLLFVCGTFYSVNGQSRNKVSVLNIFDGTLSPIIIDANDPSDLVQSLSYFDNKLYLGGNFDSLNNIAIKNLACFDLLSNSFSSWRPEPDERLRFVRAYPNKTIVSGYFNRIGAFSRNNFVSLDLITGMPTSLNIEPNGEIKSIAICRDDIFIGGEFDSIGTNPRVSLASFNINSGTINSFNAGLISTNSHITLFADSTDLYVGGYFNQFMGQTRNNIASVNIDNLSLNSLSLPLVNSVEKILKKGDSLFVIGGCFWNSSPLGTLQGLMSVNPITGNPNVLNVNPTNYSEVMAGVLVGDSIYVGGNFNAIGNVSRHNLAVFNLIVF